MVRHTSRYCAWASNVPHLHQWHCKNINYSNLRLFADDCLSCDKEIQIQDEIKLRETSLHSMTGPKLGRCNSMLRNATPREGQQLDKKYSLNCYTQVCGSLSIHWNWVPKGSEMEPPYHQCDQQSQQITRHCVQDLWPMSSWSVGLRILHPSEALTWNMPQWHGTLTTSRMWKSWKAYKGKQLNSSLETGKGLRELSHVSWQTWNGPP